MRVLVLGGTGAMGVHLLKLLKKKDVTIYVTSRAKRIGNEQVKYIQGDAHSIDFLYPILEQGWDVIVDFMSYTTTSFLSRIDNILKATNQYIYLSSGRVYGNSEGFLKEESPRLLDISSDKKFLSTDEYSLAKARQEDILRNSKYQNWTIIRPYITYSEIRLQLGVLEKEEWLYRAINGRTIVLSKEIMQQCTTLTYAEDVARVIFKIIGKKDSLTEVFHVTTNEYVSWDSILRYYLQVLENHLGYRPKVLLQDFNLFFETKPTEYQIKYDRLFHRKFDNTKACEFTGITNFTLISDGIEKCLKEFLKAPRFNIMDWKYEAIRDKQSKESTPLQEIPTFKQKVKYFIYRYLM